jgi:DNA primase
LHGGDNPTSFSWKKSTGVWSCFSRHCGGPTIKHDIYGFLQSKLNISFHESVEYLEKYLGVSEKTRPGGKCAYKAASILTQENKLRKYETQKTEILQYLPYFYKEGFNKIVEYLLSRNYRYKEIELFNFYPARDSFGFLRLGIPAYDDNGELVGVSCRLMDTILEYPSKVTTNAGKEYPVPKYRMSRFNKGAILYNLNNAKEESFKKGLVIVEGQFDVTRLHTYGIKNAVGCMGSILSNTQVALLYKYCYNITFLVEEGTAALDGVIKSIKKINPHTMNVSVAKLPAGDADSNRKDVVLSTLEQARALTPKDIIDIKNDKLLL